MVMHVTYGVIHVRHIGRYKLYTYTSSILCVLYRGFYSAFKESRSSNASAIVSYLR